MCACVCVCPRVHACLNPRVRKSAGNGGTSTAVFTFTFQQEYLIGSNQIVSMCTEEGFHVALKKASWNVNIRDQTNIIDCGLLLGATCKTCVCVLIFAMYSVPKKLSLLAKRAFLQSEDILAVLRTSKDG